MYIYSPKTNLSILNRIGGVMVSLLTSKSVYLGTNTGRVKTKTITHSLTHSLTHSFIWWFVFILVYIILKKLVLGLIDGAGLGVARMILLPVAAVCKASVQWQTTLHMHGANVSVCLKRKHKRTNNDLQTHRTSKILIVICINCIRSILSNPCRRILHLTELNGAYKKKYTREVPVDGLAMSLS